MSSQWIDTFIIYSVSLYLVIIFTLTSTFSGINMAIPAFLWLMFMWNTFLHSLFINLPILLYFKWLSYRQHTVGPCYFFPICLLICKPRWVISTLVIVDTLGLKSAFFSWFVFCFFFYFLFLISVFSFLLYSEYPEFFFTFPFSFMYVVFWVYLFFF